MNLRKLANIFKNNIKNEKTKGQESARHEVPKIPRFELFLVLTLFVVIITPIAVRLYIKISTEVKIVNLFVSARFEELFGKKITENLFTSFNETNPGIRVRLSVQDEKEPDIIIFDDQELFNEDASVSLVSFMDVLYYNIDILSEAGFNRPPRTRGEYQNYFNTINEKGFYCDDFSEPENNKPLNTKLDDFAQGKAAMIVASTRIIPLFREKLGDDAFSLTAIPYASDGTMGRYDINITGIYAEINAASTNHEAASSFIEFLAEHRASFCEMFKAVPGIKSDVIPGDYVNGDPFYSKAWDIFEFNKSEGLQE